MVNVSLNIILIPLSLSLFTFVPFFLAYLFIYLFMFTFFADDTLTCVCYDKQANDTSPEDILSELIRNLTIDKSSLSSTRRQLTSADDHRISAKCLGISGVFIMVSFCSLFIINDAITYSVYQCNKRCLFDMDSKVKHIYC